MNWKTKIWLAIAALAIASFALGYFLQAIINLFY